MRLTDYLAIYGAVLSTAVAVLNALRARSKIRVYLTFAVETVEGETQHGVGISIQNPSAHTAHISSVSFLYQYKISTLRGYWKHVVRFKPLPRHEGWCHTAPSNFGLEDGCPVSIEPDKSHWIFVADAVLEKLFDGAGFASPESAGPRRALAKQIFQSFRLPQNSGRGGNLTNSPACRRRSTPADRRVAFRTKGRLVTIA